MFFFPSGSRSGAGDKRSTTARVEGPNQLERTKVLPNPHLSKKGLVDEISDLGSGWLYENYHIPFVLEERKVSREKIKEVPEEIIHHRNKVLDILREIEDHMEDEFNKERPNDCHPTEPTPYHKPNRLRVVKKEIQSFKDEVGITSSNFMPMTLRIRREHLLYILCCLCTFLYQHKLPCNGEAPSPVFLKPTT